MAASQARSESSPGVQLDAVPAMGRSHSTRRHCPAEASAANSRMLAWALARACLEPKFISTGSALCRSANHEHNNLHLLGLSTRLAHFRCIPRPNSFRLLLRSGWLSARAHWRWAKGVGQTGCWLSLRRSVALFLLRGSCLSRQPIDALIGLASGICHLLLDQPQHALDGFHNLAELTFNGGHPSVLVDAW